MHNRNTGNNIIFLFYSSSIFPPNRYVEVLINKKKKKVLQLNLKNLESSKADLSTTLNSTEYFMFGFHLKKNAKIFRGLSYEIR